MGKKHQKHDLPSIWAPEQFPTNAEDRREYFVLCTSVTTAVIMGVAARIVARRAFNALVNRGETPESIQAAWDTMRELEQIERTQHEVEQLIQLQNQHGHSEGVDTWLAAAARDYPLPADAPPYRREDFDRERDELRTSLDRARSLDRPVARLWRRHHPGWSPKHKPKQRDTFELQLDRFRARFERWDRAHPVAG